MPKAAFAAAQHSDEIDGSASSALAAVTTTVRMNVAKRARPRAGVNRPDRIAGAPDFYELRV